MKAQPRICVIGAGPSGLTTLKNLRSLGFTDVTCYEATGAIGGNWVYSEAEGHSSVYASTHLISSRKLSQFEDFPMPDGYPDFPSHEQVLAYFQAYAAAFNVMPFIRFHARVIKAERRGDGVWCIKVAGRQGESEAFFDYLFVCSGHHFDPLIPAYPGTFTGRILHSHAYKTAEPFRGQRVLVVGGGNSACDIAADLSRVARRTALSMRRGYYIIPKIIYGMPVDIGYRRLRHLPKPLRQWLLEKMLSVAVGRWERYGLQAPKGRVMAMHPTLNTDVLTQLRHGRIAPRVGIERFAENTVEFSDGHREAFDAIIFGTGYRTSFPFFDPAFIDFREALRLPLYLKMMSADIPNLFFIGLFQPIGCIWTLADHQAHIAALQIAGRLTRPADIAERIEREMKHTHWSFEAHIRHAAEVDYHDFRRELLKVIARARPAAEAA